MLGCGTVSSVAQVSPNVYIVTIEDHNGIFAFGRAKMKTKAITQANEFAKKAGKIAIPVSITEHPVGILGDWATIEYQFRLVDEGSPEARDVALIQRPDVVVEHNQKSDAKVEIKTDGNKDPDLYTELLKLEDLRKRGLLTDEEFENQKKVLLDKKSR